MWIALYVKEWREKALVFFFELGLLALLIGAQVLVQKKDLREWLVYAVLMLFFPFAALLLGAAGFEAEYRQGAWAYIFSRPVSRVALWLAKFGAALSMFTALWLVFAAAWAALPAVRALAAGPRVFLQYVTETGFPWWSVAASLFLLIVAFSLSIIHERQLQLMFLSLVLGLFLVAAAWALIISKAGGYLAWIAPTKALRTLVISLGLMALAFIGASLQTLLRSDFSQPRHRTRTFGIWFVPLLILALACTVATALWVPVPGEHGLFFVASSDGKALYFTERGLFSYDSSSGRVSWLTGSKQLIYPGSSLVGGRLAYAALKMRGLKDAVVEIWVVNADGTGRTRVLGPGSPAPWPGDPDVRDVMISPDGRKIAILTHSPSPGGSRNADMTLWTVNIDGSGLEKRHTESAESNGGYSYPMSYFVAWERQKDALIIQAIHKRPSSKPAGRSLWRYDLDARTYARIRDNAGPALRRISTRPEGDLLAIKYPLDDFDPPAKLALLNLSTLEETEVAEGGLRAYLPVQWDPAGQRLSFSLRRPESGGQEHHVLAIYSVSERKIIAERNIIARSESEVELLWTAWMPDGRSLVALEEGHRSLSIFGPDLQETDRVDLPARIKEPWGSATVGNQVLIEDSKTDSLWRLDLGTKRWKRIY